ncbi:fimbrial protein [Citrobacter sp. Cb003]|uniref:fimbrial protein n=1 Tax=Citrobacter sp. Cb003 TaxID=2985005 RepID=UPI00257E6CE0|nr:fimbrial protein [Citrobacter sp. Cb003]MDM3379284.1 fimbrial protein [Citrobacter sp. Cb003]
MNYLPVALMFSLGLHSLNVHASEQEVHFLGMLIEAPPCVINENKMIKVNFGSDIMTTRIDGVNYKKPIDFGLDCSQAASNSQKLRIRGDTALFDNSVLYGNKTGLGIAIYNGSVKLPIDQWVNFTMPNVPSLSAVLVKQNGITLSGGPFSVLASLVVDYQ